MWNEEKNVKARAKENVSIPLRRVRVSGTSRPSTINYSKDWRHFDFALHPFSCFFVKIKLSYVALPWFDGSEICKNGDDMERGEESQRDSDGRGKNERESRVDLMNTRKGSLGTENDLEHGFVGNVKQGTQRSTFKSRECRLCLSTRIYANKLKIWTHCKKMTLICS